MTVPDHNAFADDLHSLGLKALSSSVRKGTLTTERVLRSVERLRDRRKGAEDVRGAKAAQDVLERWGAAA